MKSISERFEEKFIPEPNSGCWLWIGAESGINGYGQFRWSSNKCMKAHRAAWCLYKDNIPYGIDVLHHCDNPSCVNPDHLFLGDHGDNMRDMIRKNRGNKVCGSKHHQAKITEDIVRDIRQWYANGITQIKIASIVRLRHQMISNIVNRKNWKHVL